MRTWMARMANTLRWGVLSLGVLLSLGLPWPAAAQVSFAPKADFATGDHPQAVAVADLNGDGKLDVVTANPGWNTGFVSVFLNTAPAVADLGVTIGGAPDPVVADESLTYTVTVTNNGLNPASGVTLLDALPAGVTLVSAIPSQGACTGTTTITCGIGPLDSGGTATVTIVVTPAAPGTLTNTVTVMGNVDDSTPDNNTATAATTVQDATPPTIEHTPIRSAAVNRSITIRATISDNVGVRSATLFYKTPEASLYVASFMTASGSTFSAAIPASAVTKAGVQYYVEASDANNIIRSPGTAPTTPYSVVVGTSVFTDDPPVARTTPIKAVHFTELRMAISALWTKYSVSGVFPDWGGPVRAAHLISLRTALDAAHFKARNTHLTFESIQMETTPIKASHLSELRTFVRNLE
ncbi:MAG TPA: hypothetical protein VLT62_09190 [Candidatus Methylomirabilis sp.]|nr:hypothetical protein [Candidatus Methylomirabilis sp.]